MVFIKLIATCVFVSICILCVLFINSAHKSLCGDWWLCEVCVCICMAVCLSIHLHLILSILLLFRSNTKTSFMIMNDLGGQTVNNNNNNFKKKKRKTVDKKYTDEKLIHIDAKYKAIHSQHSEKIKIKIKIKKNTHYILVWSETWTATVHRRFFRSIRMLDVHTKCLSSLWHINFILNQRNIVNKKPLRSSHFSFSSMQTPVNVYVCHSRENQKSIRNKTKKKSRDN